MQFKTDQYLLNCPRNNCGEDMARDSIQTAHPAHAARTRNGCGGVGLAMLRACQTLKRGPIAYGERPAIRCQHVPLLETVQYARYGFATRADHVSNLLMSE